MKEQNLLPMAAVNVGAVHSNQSNFLQHSEEPAGRMKSLDGQDLARGPVFETPSSSTTFTACPSPLECTDLPYFNCLRKYT